MLRNDDEGREIVRDVRARKDSAHARLHAGAVEGDECGRHCFAECLSADADAECCDSR
jgi:hypothetical protein